MPVSTLLCRVSALLIFLGSAFFGPLPAPAIDNPTGQKFQAVPDDLATLVAARQQNSQDQVTERALETVVESGLPVQLPSAWLPSLPVDAMTLPDDLGTKIIPKAYLPTPATEPQHSWTFSHVLYVYVPVGTKGTNRLFCRLHYAQDSDTDLAERMGGLLPLIHRTLVTRTGQEAANGTAAFDVWLCRQGQSGGEQWRSNIYFYDLGTPRSSIEWIREIVHEYGHLALPAIGGYTDPEYWANGYYGERLITRWMARMPGGPALVSQVWGDFSGWPNFQQLLIAPALALYQRSGPSPAMAARTDEIGMRYLIGQILTFDDKYGALRLGEVFTHLPRFREAKASDFETAITDTVPDAARHRP